MELDRPVLDITWDGFFELPESTQQTLLLQVSHVGTIADIAALKQCLLEFVHVNNLQNAPVRLTSLNRRFYRAAKGLGTTVADVVRDLCAAGTLTSTYIKGNFLLSTTAVMTQRDASLADAFSTFGPEDAVIQRAAADTQYYESAR